MKNYEVIIFETKKCLKPVVYIFYENENPLYVGYSGNGIGRPFSNEHHQREAHVRSTHIEIRIFDSKEDAMKEESRLIREINPAFNGKGGIRSNGKRQGGKDSDPVTLRSYITPVYEAFSQECDLRREFKTRKY